VHGLGLATQAGGAEHGALRQVLQALGLVAEEGVAGVFALRDGGDAEAVGQHRRHVLQGMDGAVDAALQQGLLDLLGEHALAADLQQTAVLHPVAGGGDDDQRGGRGHGGGVLRVGAQGGGDAALHVAGLGEAELRATGANSDCLLRRHGLGATSERT
jgi:hypothetical protein